MANVSAESLEHQFDPYPALVDHIVQDFLKKPVPEPIMDYWLVMAQASRMLSWQVHSLHDRKELRQFQHSTEEFLTGVSHDAPETHPLVRQKITQLRNALEDYKITIPGAQYNLEKTYEQGRLIFSTVDTLRETSGIKELIRLRRTEGESVSRMFLTMLPRDYKDHPNYPNLDTWLSHGMRLGILFDQFLDMGSDYQNGDHLVVPTTVNRLRIIPAMIQDYRVGSPLTSSELLKWGWTEQVPKIASVFIRNKLLKK